ncbi:unnamed protein product [Paramecium octaurelia]|uniref:Uncharacterized protein n=1 Tax=Paramecium octaurelia TaxID=43137 RepID=A0A8S1XZ18_PAROT|nr:unnamed protein product [Paramecium octaurelia]
MQQQLPLRQTNQIRPSIFLNNLDLNSVLLSPKLISSDFEKSPLISQLKYTNKLPLIKEKPTISISNKESLENTLYNDSSSQPSSMKIAFQSGEHIKLPPIQLASPKNETKHKKNFTEGNLVKKRVEFRASILVIDFINQVMKKDKIDGSAKPLIRKGMKRELKEQN